MFLLVLSLPLRHRPLLLPPRLFGIDACSSCVTVTLLVFILTMEDEWESPEVLVVIITFWTLAFVFGAVTAAAAFGLIGWNTKLFWYFWSGELYSCIGSLAFDLSVKYKIRENLNRWRKLELTYCALVKLQAFENQRLFSWCCFRYVVGSLGSSCRCAHHRSNSRSFTSCFCYCSLLKSYLLLFTASLRSLS